jgi:hypothetical protein
MEISIYALMMAIKSVQRDIVQHEKLASDDSLSDDDLDYYGQQVLDLTKVFGELCMAYETAQKADTTFPTLENLIEKI